MQRPDRQQSDRACVRAPAAPLCQQLPLEVQNESQPRARAIHGGSATFSQLTKLKRENEIKIKALT